MIQPPADKEIFESDIARYWWEDGMLISLSKNPKRTVENIRSNATLIQQITGSKPVPLLIYLSNSPVSDKAARKFATEMLPVIYSAMAMVSKPGLSKFIMNILFAVKPPPIPIKSFSDDIAARKWLKQYIK
jgi:hypothetical protein